MLDTVTLKVDRTFHTKICEGVGVGEGEGEGGWVRVNQHTHPHPQ